MIKKLTTASRRTPILAIILAPVALFLLVQFWTHALVPLYQGVWYSDTVLKWRLASDEPAIRIEAAKDAGLRRAEGAALADILAASLQTDESVEVRKAAATALGQLGLQRPFSAAANQALSTLILTEPDDAMLSAVIVAVGQSAANNRYLNPVIERIAEISGEKHLAWMYPRATRALGQIGAAQPLPESVFTLMNARFADPRHASDREDLANAFAEISKGEALPVATLDILAAAFEDEPNRRIRKAIINALAYAADDYPPSIALITTATSDPDGDIARTAESGLRIIEYNRTLADKDPLSVAMDASESTETRLAALRIIRSTKIDPAARKQLAALAQDPNARIAVAAIDIFPYLARSVAADFDRRTLIPALSRAMSHSDPLVRRAAFGALSTIARNRPDYLRTADFPAQLDAGADDPDPKVRVIALVILFRDDSRRAAVIKRGMNDPDPYVRSNAVSWLALPETTSSQREEPLAESLNDPDPSVRRSAEAAQQNWESRERAWPIELWQLWQAGQRGTVGMRVLITVTVAAPVIICGVFLLYFMARFLTYVQQRRWRAAVLIPVLATWAAASYGMFLLYFVAGHAGNTDVGETAILAGILWGAIAVYAALGWGMHFAVHR